MGSGIGDAQTLAEVLCHPHIPHPASRSQPAGRLANTPGRPSGASVLRTLGFTPGVASIGAALWAMLRAPAHVAAIALPAALAAAALVADGLLTGAVWSRGGEVDRAEAPVEFALTCGSYVGVAVLMLFVAFRV